MFLSPMRRLPQMVPGGVIARILPPPHPGSVTLCCWGMRQSPQTGPQICSSYVGLPLPRTAQWASEVSFSSILLSCSVSLPRSHFQFFLALPTTPLHA